MNGLFSERAVSGPRLWAFRFIAAVIVPTLLLAGLEVCLRLGGVGVSSELTVACTVDGRKAFCDNQFFTAQFFGRALNRPAAPYAIAADKPPGTYRIFIMGESAAAGSPEPSYGFARYLEVMLHERFPEKKFEIINTAITAINSHVILPIARELAQHQPDLFVIYMGNNEVLGPYGPGTVFASLDRSLPFIRASIALRASRLGQSLDLLLTRKDEQPGKWHGLQMFVGHQIAADDPRLSQVYTNFERNLRAIIKVARGSGARVLLSTVGTNLKDSGPFASLHRNHLTEDEFHTWDEFYDRGVKLEADGRYAAALGFYSAAQAVDDQYANLHFRMGRSQWKLGHFSEAKDHFTRARELDSLRFRADSSINDIIRQVGQSADSGMALVDVVADLAAASPGQTPGSNVFYEHVHLNPHGNYLVARSIFSRVEGWVAGETGAKPGNMSVLSQADVERQLAYTGWARQRIAQILVHEWEFAPYSSQVNHREMVQGLQSDLAGGKETDEEIDALYRRAIAKAPKDRLLHLYYAFFLGDRQLRENRMSPGYGVPAPYGGEAVLEQFNAARPFDNAGLPRNIYSH